MDILLWAIAAVIFLAVEFGTVALVSVWFAGGSLAALVAAVFGAPAWLQILLFALVSVALLLLLRPFLKRYVDPLKTKTNVDALSGRRALVTEEIDNLHGTGTIKLEGKLWTARSTDDTVIPAGAVVVVQRVEGVKAMVLPEPAAASVS